MIRELFATCACAATVLLSGAAEVIPLAPGAGLDAQLDPAQNYMLTLGCGKTMLLERSHFFYHGRSGNTTNFYMDQEEQLLPAGKLVREGNTATVSFSTVEFNITRSIGTIPDEPGVVTFGYELAARYSGEFPCPALPRMVWRKPAQVSCNLDPDFKTFETAAEPNKFKLARACAVFLHYPEIGKTVLFLADLNAPRPQWPLGFAPTISMAKNSMVMKLEPLYAGPFNYMKTGDTQRSRCCFALLDGAELTDAHKARAAELAARLKIVAPDFDTANWVREYEEPGKAAGILAADDLLTVWGESSAKKVYPLTALPQRQIPAIELESAANEWESAQIVLTPKRTTKLDAVEFTDLVAPNAKIDRANCRVRFLEYQRGTTLATAYHNRELIGDKLLELGDAPRDLRVTVNQALWLSVKTPAGTPAGVYSGSVKVTVGGKEYTIPLKLKVWDFELPKNDKIFRAFGVLWSSPQSYRAETLRAIAECQMSGCGNAGGRRELQAGFDGTEMKFPDDLRTAEKAVKEYGANAMPVPYVFMGAWDWKPGKKVYCLDMDVKDPRFEPLFSNYLRSVYRQLKERGIVDQSFVYMWDEVTAGHYDAMRYTIDLVHKNAPGVKVLTVGAPDPEVVRANDIICTGTLSNWWCPEAEKIIRDGKAQGKEFWIYLNGETFVPGYEAAIPRLTPWRCFAHGISGYLQWSMDYRWDTDFDRNGHVWLLYPHDSKPVLSVRLERFRDGVEDYIYLHLLSQLPAERRAAIEKEINALAPAYGPTQVDADKLLEIRHKIGEELSRK